MAIQDVVRWLLPRSDYFFVFLERQSESMHAAAGALAQLVSGTPSDAIVVTIQTHEETGDAALQQLEEALEQNFVAPIDRDDLQALGSDLHRVLMLTSGSARLFGLLGLDGPTPAMGELMTTLVHCTSQLQAMIPAMRRHDYASLMATSRTLRKEVKRARTVVRDALSAAFHESEDVKQILRETRILQHLGQAIHRCDRVAHRLANLAVKHG